MDREQFERGIIQPLLRSSNSGDTTNEAGTRLIGHVPTIAPKAFTHVIYSPIESVELQELEQRYGSKIPEEVSNFLALSNGMMIFSGSIRVFGYEPLERRFDSGIHNYPSSVSIPNISTRVRGSNEGSFIIGWYKADGSYVSIEHDGNVLRFKPRDDGKIIKSWPNFYNWLTTEIANYQD